MNAALWAGLLFVGMLALLELGRRIGRRRIERDPEGARTGTGALDGAVFGLFGLLVAFTFSGAASRFDERRQLTVEEANNVGTAWLRLDLLPEEAQPALRDLFRRYLDSRIETYRLLPDVNAAFEEISRSQDLQREIWTRALAASREAAQAGSSQATMLLLPALNQMIDVTTTRTMAAQMHPPMIIFIMLVALSLAAALLAGTGMAGTRRRSWTHVLVFATVVAVSVYVILDIEYPRLGLIRVDAVDQALVQLRESMNLR